MGRVGSEQGMKMSQAGLSEPIVELVAWLDQQGPEGRAGLRCLLQEIDRRAPGEIDRIQARRQLRSLGVHVES